VGMLDTLRGNAQTLDPGEAAAEFGCPLAPGEVIELAYILVRDVVLLTSKRLILVDKQGVTGKKDPRMEFPRVRQVLRPRGSAGDSRVTPPAMPPSTLPAAPAPRSHRCRGSIAGHPHTPV
jgi:hypothetical protein